MQERRDPQVNFQEGVPTRMPKGEAQKEISSRDFVFLRSVDAFFGPLDNFKTDNLTEEDVQFRGYLTYARDSLSKLANPKVVEQKRPAEAAIGLSHLLGIMAEFNPSSRRNQEHNPFSEKNYADAKNIFMSACAKLFPEIKSRIGKEDFVENAAVNILDQYRKWGTEDRYVPEKGHEEDIIGQIDQVLKDGASMSVFGFERYNDENDKDGRKLAAGKSRITQNAKTMYTLQLIRDRLAGQDYSRADITPREVQELQKAREVVGLGNETESKEAREARELLAEIDKRGRMTSYNSASVEFAEKRRRGRGSGFGSNPDQKDWNDAIRVFSQDRKNFNLDYSILPEGMAKEQSIDLRRIFVNSGVESAIMLRPINRREPIYETKKVTKGVVFKREEFVQEEIGIKEVPIAISEFNGNQADAENAYDLVFYVCGPDQTKESARGYKDITTGRFGGFFTANIILPEKLARSIFALIQKDPLFAKKVVGKLDPELMKEEEKVMPEIKNMLIIPEGNPLDVLEEYNLSSGGIEKAKIKNKYLKQIK